MKNKRKILIIIFILLVLLTIVYNKTHHKVVCEVVSIENNIVTIIRPDNNLYYEVEVEDISNYEINDFVSVTFDELTDWEKNYFIRNISPTE